MYTRVCVCVCVCVCVERESQKPREEILGWGWRFTLSCFHKDIVVICHLKKKIRKEILKNSMSSKSSGSVSLPPFVFVKIKNFIPSFMLRVVGDFKERRFNDDSAAVKIYLR